MDQKRSQVSLCQALSSNKNAAKWMHSYEIHHIYVPKLSKQYQILA